ncbi:MAG: DUF3830 family protein [Chloroflexota bacterium]|nr:DUF3830 family protein [Chloroflexota bacterium]MDE3193638.1 DUF3830 family protein [Chloroflexota bacterium]
MAKRIRVRVGSATAEGTLYEDKAPKTVAALWSMLPIKDRTIQVRWSGDAWRTENNYELQPADAPVENVAGRLSAGDVIYYPEYKANLIKVGIAYGKAQWLAPFMVPVQVALIGKLDAGLEDFVTQCQRIIFEGPLGVEMTRIE